MSSVSVVARIYLAIGLLFALRIAPGVVRRGVADVTIPAPAYLVAFALAFTLMLSAFA